MVYNHFTFYIARNYQSIRTQHNLARVIILKCYSCLPLFQAISYYLKQASQLDLSYFGLMRNLFYFHSAVLSLQYFSFSEELFLSITPPMCNKEAFDILWELHGNISQCLSSCQRPPVIVLKPSLQPDSSPFISMMKIIML